ncbi:mechanosensitive ion channel family protein [Colwellia echini]|uniref:Small-conductance mechanosensitive channel n=1 Tax=Colwellia echini TaxID=1982103 RepID=A0ABY3N0A5_9GAMM|nr:mechanosensitive ion channel domain-containing protein [Colwellia echini]TYK66687.1 mechanosensitive ion channel [Colwellia echini]
MKVLITKLTSQKIAQQKLTKLLLSVLFFTPVIAQAESTEPPELEVISTLATMVKPSGLFLSLLLFIGVWLLLKMVKSVVDDLSEVFAEKRLLLQKSLVFFQFIIYFFSIATATIISFEFSTELIALLGGTLAVAIGFAIKDLAASVIAGVIIMFDRPFQVGDRVLFGGEYGDIIAIGIRSVKMNTLDDNVVTIPNNIFLNGITSCGNYGELDMQVAIKFFIAVDQNLTLAQYIVREAAALSKFAYLKKPINVLVLQEMSNNMVYYKLTVKVYVLDTKYEKALETDITLRVNEAFTKEGIYSPSLHLANQRPLVSEKA